MATRWAELKHKASPQKRDRLRREALAEYEAVQRGGRGLLRNARQQTQLQLAEEMHVPQSAISRIERQQDCRLSTLQRYVTALGGRLELRAVFADDTVELDRLLTIPVPAMAGRGRKKQAGIQRKPAA